MRDFYMRLAHECGQMSRARRLKVGCVIVKDNNILSFSWNGTPPGWDNNCEHEIKWPNGEIRFLETKAEVIHAERNALDKLARTIGHGQGSVMFCTHSPCMECAKSIFGAGIRHVIYDQEYRSKEGVDFLVELGVEVEKFSQTAKYDNYIYDQPTESQR